MSDLQIVSNFATPNENQPDALGWIELDQFHWVGGFGAHPCLLLNRIISFHFTSYKYPLFVRFFSHVGHHRALSRVPCAVQQVLISYVLYIIVCICQSQPPNSSPFSPLVSVHLFSTLCLCFCFANRFICTIFLDSTYMY